MFLEQTAAAGWFSTRTARFYAAYTESWNWPAIIINSGHTVAQGVPSAGSSYYKWYKGLVDAELARPAQADVSAAYKQVGNHFDFQVSITNLSGVTLSNSVNGATVFVVLYEDVTRVGRDPNGVSVTSRIDRAVEAKSISTLENGASATYTITTADLDPAVVNFANLHAVAFVDYRPGGSSGPYDMLQAAIAVEKQIIVNPTSLSFTADSVLKNDLTGTLTVTETPDNLSWSITSKPSWVTVSPASGSVGDSTTVTVHVDMLQPDHTYDGSIKFTSGSNPGSTRYVNVHVTYPPEPSLNVSQSTVGFIILPDNPSLKEATVQVTGYPSGLSWSVTEKPSWATVTPTSGVVGSSLLVTVDYHDLPSLGSYNGVIRLAATISGLELTSTIDVNVFYDYPYNIYLPVSCNQGN